MKSGIDRIAAKALSDKKFKFTSLAHHINEQLLWSSFKEIPNNSSSGIDNKSKQESLICFKRWTGDVITKVHSKGYKPPPVKRVFIPKPGKSELRPIGIPTILDRCLQIAVSKVLTPIYERNFLECSYGGRPSRNAHQAIKSMTDAIFKHKVSWIYEADIKNFFGSLDHEMVFMILKDRVGDPRILSLIRKWLQAGVMNEGRLCPTEAGVPQGGPISVLISNIYLHYVLDLWIDKVVKPRMRGQIHYVRYIDDFVLGFQYKDDAERFKEVLSKRLLKFSLTLEPSKTRLIRFGKLPAASSRKKRPETFCFLGFTFYCAKSKKGNFRVGRRTEKSRLKRSISSMKSLITKLRHTPLKHQANQINLVLMGHYRYYGIGGNYSQIAKFYRISTRLWLNGLRSRTQRHHLTWEKFNRILNVFPLSKPKVYVPY